MLELVMMAALAGEPPTVVAAAGKGVTITSADESFSLQIRGRAQIRETFTAAAPGDDGTRALSRASQIKTLRLVLSGNTVTTDLKYQFQFAFAGSDYRDGATSPLFDAYLDYTKNPNLSVKVGQYFVPFDRARTIKESALQTLDRSRPVSELTLDRDVGITLYSDHLGGENSPFAYRLGAFGGAGTNLTTSSKLGRLFVGRLELRPLGKIDDDSDGDLERRKEPGLAIGVAAAYDLNTPRQKETTGTTFTGGTATYLNLAGDMVFKARGFSLLGEGLYRHADEDELHSTDADGNAVTEYTRSGWGFLVQPSLMVSDHAEVVARYSKLAAFDGTDPKLVSDVGAKGNEVVAGANWYANGHRLKVQADWTGLFDASFAAPEHAVHVGVDVSF